MPHRSEVSSFLVEAGVLAFGDFTLKSGKRSPYFLNFGQVHSGRHLAQLGGFYARFLQEHLGGRFDLLYGPPYKGIPLAVAASQALWTEHRVDCGFLSYRKEDKPHGEGGTLLGRRPSTGDRIVLIDDVMTSGGTKLEAMERLRPLHPQFAAVLVAVDREERDETGQTAARRFEEECGVPVFSLLRLSELAEELLQSQMLTPEQHERIRLHLEGAPS